MNSYELQYINIDLSFKLQLAAYYKEHDLNVMWISDDEIDSKESKAPLSKKTHQDVNKGRCLSCKMKILIFISAYF